MGLKRIARQLAGGFVGGLQLAGPIARGLGGRAAILAYHRVLDPAVHDPEAVEPGMFVRRDAFAAHLQLLQRDFHVVPLAELARRLLTGEKIRPRTVVITFDDGWLDTYETAYPLLRAAGLPATVFVPTALVGSPTPFWFSRAAALARRFWERRDELAASFPDEGMPPAADFLMQLLVDDPPRAGYFGRVLSAGKALAEPEREAMLGFLERITGEPLKCSGDLVSWEQLRRMSADVFEIGSHTVNHVILTQADDETIKRELALSRQTIAEKIGVAPASFCYPNGDYDKPIALLVARAGYACALTTRAGFANRRPDLYALPRLGVHEGIAATANGLALLLSGIG